jgi:hypothetical protein
MTRILSLVWWSAHGAGRCSPDRHVIPNVPVRQWVLSLPIPLHYLLAAHLHLLRSYLEMLIPGQFVQRFGNCSDMVTEKYLDGRSPLGFAMTAVIVVNGDCFLLSLRVQRSNPVQR